MKILAVDPGGMTGWAWCDSEVLDTTFEAGELPAWNFMTWVETFIARFDLVVCEAFVITTRTAKLSQQTISLELIGALKFLGMHHGVEFELQKPAEAKSFDPKGVRLKQLGIWPKTTDHAQDAARHLLLALVRHKLIDPRKLVVG